MLEGLTQYIKNISFFIIFMAFIGIILPNERYKSYIDVVLGLILMIILLQPITGLFFGQNSVERLIDPALLEVNKSVATDGGEYQEMRNQMVLENMNMLMEKQVESLLQPLGYEVVNFGLQYNEETGEILNMNVEVCKKDEGNKKNESTAFIRVEPIEIENKPTKKEDVNQDEEIKMLKTVISDFYNLNEDNIHIKVVGNA